MDMVGVAVSQGNFLGGPCPTARCPTSQASTQCISHPPPCIPSAGNPRDPLPSDEEPAGLCFWPSPIPCLVTLHETLNVLGFSLLPCTTRDETKMSKGTVTLGFVHLFSWESAESGSSQLRPRSGLTRRGSWVCSYRHSDPATPSVKRDNNTPGSLGCYKDGMRCRGHENAPSGANALNTRGFSTAQECTHWSSPSEFSCGLPTRSRRQPRKQSELCSGKASSRAIRDGTAAANLRRPSARRPAAKEHAVPRGGVFCSFLSNFCVVIKQLHVEIV